MSRYKEQSCINPKCSKMEVMPKNSLCYICEEKLRGYDHLKGRLENLESRKLETFKLVNGSSFTKRSRCFEQEDKEVAEFDEQFIDFLKSVSVHTYTGECGVSVSLSEGSYHHNREGFCFELPIEYHLFARFQYAIHGLCQRSYANGVKYGRNLLFQLNNGDITPDQLEGKVNDVNRI